MFVDEITVKALAGRGGDGCVSFHREKYVMRGGPNGGDGGDGGSVILVASEDVHGFLDVRGRTQLKARNGMAGTGNNRHGRAGQDLIVRVPIGTEIRDAETGVLLKDLVANGDEVVVARGGAGGRGNARFTHAERQAPRFAEEGRAGGARRLRLSLKLIADAGLVGLPNAGKSTLLARLSNSRTRAGGYQFTTLGPHLGVVELSEMRRITIADLPGLIEGAHEGRGLGIQFLKHVERTRLLVHLVTHDPSGTMPPADEAYLAIRRELEAYSPELAAKPEILALSKCDLPGADESLNLLRSVTDAEVSAFSAVSGEGVRELLVRLLRALETETDDG